MSIASYSNLLSDLIVRYKNQVDFLSIRLEQAEGTNIVLRGEKIETLSQGISLGGQVRTCHRGGWGFATFNKISTLAEQIEEAIAAAKLVGEEETILAAITPVTGSYSLPLLGRNPKEVELREKKALCDHYNNLLREYNPSKIATTSVTYGDIQHQTLLATSEGTLLEQSWFDLEMRFSAVARLGDVIQTGRETTGSRQGYQDLVGLETHVIGAAQRAVDSLLLPSVQGNTYTVVIDPILTGLFVHEAFGHLSEADMLYENPDLLEAMSMGRRFGPENLQIFDGAVPAGHRGSYLFDDEGTPATTTQLLRGWCLSRPSPLQGNSRKIRRTTDREC